MSDSNQRRGTDFGSLRGLNAASSRAPHAAEDPLAELQRLVSQGEQSRSSSGSEPRSSGASQRGYVPPAVDRAYDRIEPSPGRPAQQQNYDPRTYGAPAEPDYDPNDFFDDPASQSQPGGYGAYPEEEDDFGAGFPPRGARPAFHDELDSGDFYPGMDEDAGRVPASGRGRLVIGSVLALVLLGGIGAWALGGFGGSPDETPTGAPPLIRADNDNPVKVVPQAQPVARAKESYDRVDPNASATVVPSAEEPGEKPSPRVILPGAPAPGTERRVIESAPDQPQNDSNAGRRVKTIAIRPDGSVAPSAAEPSSSAQALVQPTPPATIEGVGPAAGMSMQPSSDGGIMAAETAPLAPMPTPRPIMPQQRQADPYAVQSIPAAPAARTAAPATGGPPSTPQPQVTLTNKRPLQPSGAPPAAAAPRQTAMAQPAPTAQVPARQAGTQVATLPGGAGGFGVQLTAQRSEAEALAAFNALKQRNPAALGAYNATIARADLGDKGVFYRALVPAATQAEASNLCIQFKSAGVDCIVQRR